MSWPPPNVASATPPPPHPANSTAEPASTPPSRAETARPVAAWLAATGAALVLVAAIIAVAGDWQRVATGVTFAGLATITTAFVVIAERTRTSVPTTASAMAQLGATLLAPVGVAGAAMFGQPWPVCVLLGGVLASATCAVQVRRWNAPLLDVATAAAIGLALTGAAGLTPLPIGILGAIAALGLLAVRRDVSAVVLGLASAASPVLVALAQQRFGAGTLARIGATGDVLMWSAPATGVLAGGALAIVATRRDASSLAIAALAAPLVGIVTGMGRADVGVLAWLCMLALVLIALETVVAIARSEMWRGLAALAANVLVALLGTVALVAPALSFELLPIVLTGIGLAMATRRHSNDIRALASGAVGSLVIAALINLGTAPLLPAAAAAACAALSVIVPTRRSSLTVLHCVAGLWGTALVLVHGSNAWWSNAAAAFITLVLMAATLERSDAGATPAVAMAGTVVAATCFPTAPWTTVLVTLAVAVVHIVWRRPSHAPVLFVMTCTAATLAVLAPETVIPIGLVAVAVAGAVMAWWTNETWPAHAAAVALVGAAAFSATWSGLSASETAIVVMIAAVVLTGWAFISVRLTPVGTAGFACGLLSAHLADMAGQPWLVSLAVTVIGLQCTLHGATRRSAGLTWGGVCLTAGGVSSTWFTSGANDAVVTWLRPYGVTVGDLTVAAVAAALFAAGAVARRTLGSSSWLTVAPGLTLTCAWLLHVEFSRAETWSLPLLLVTGVIAVGVGGVRRLAAPLVIGTVTLGTTLVSTAGPRLAELDSWVWLAVGGTALIAVAVLVERAVNGDNAETVDWHRLRETWR